MPGYICARRAGSGHIFTAGTALLRQARYRQGRQAGRLAGRLAGRQAGRRRYRPRYTTGGEHERACVEARPFFSLLSLSIVRAPLARSFGTLPRARGRIYFISLSSLLSLLLLLAETRARSGATSRLATVAAAAFRRIKPRTREGRLEINWQRPLGRASPPFPRAPE